MAKGWTAKLKKGALTKMAKAKGMTCSQFCSQPKKKLSAIARKR